MDTASSRDGGTDLVSPCDCHKLNTADWPWRNGTIQVALCMSCCPYCGMQFSSWVDLQYHLGGKQYKARNLELVLEMKTLPETSKKNKNINSKKEPNALKRSGNLPSRKSTLNTNRESKESYPKRSLPEKTQKNQKPSSSHTISRPEPPVSPDQIEAHHSKLYSPPRVTHSAKVKELLSLIQDFEDGKELYKLSLSTVDEMPPEMNEMWKQSTITYPQIFKSAHCWKEEPPTKRQLFLETLKLIDARKLAEKNGTEDDYKAYCPAYANDEYDPSLDPREAIFQLCDPNKQNPIAICGYRLPPEFLADSALRTPKALTKNVEPFDEDNLQILLTPKFWITDLHIDNFDGISTTIEKCEKIWIAFPPTPKNLQLMQDADAQRSKWIRIGKDLEGGLVYKTTSSDAIYLPVGCIHAVFTVEGGFLFTIEFSTPDSVKVLSSLFNSHFDKFKDVYAKAELPSQFIQSVDLALQQNRPLVGLKSWIDMEERLRRWADKSEDHNPTTKNKEWIKRRQKWKEEIARIWESFFNSLGSEKLSCPCGKMRPNQSLEKHFCAAHLFESLLPQPKPRPRGGVSATAGTISHRRKRRRRSDSSVE